VRRAFSGAISACLFAGVTAAATRLHHLSGPVHLDRLSPAAVVPGRLAGLLARLRLGRLATLVDWRAVVSLASPAVGVVAALALASVAWARRDRLGAVLCLAPVLAVVITELVAKPLVDRRLGPGLAFPSGHATTAAAVVALVVLLAHRHRGWMGVARVAGPAVAFLAVVAAALVRLGYHYPTDVVGGIAVGIATVLAVNALVPEARPHPAS